MRNLLFKRPCVRSLSKHCRVGSLFDTKTLYENCVAEVLLHETSVIEALLCEKFSLGRSPCLAIFFFINNRAISWFLISCNCWNISVKGTDILVDVV